MLGRLLPERGKRHLEAVNGAWVRRIIGGFFRGLRRDFLDSLEDSGMGNMRSWALLSVAALGACAQLAACTSSERREAAPGIKPSTGQIAATKGVAKSLQNAFPQARIDASI